jgi:transcriptional regulator with XRE-family HTH domain
MTRERYKPVPLDLDATRERWVKDAAFARAYAALADEFAALAELVRARQRAELTQAQVAERMGVAQATVGRLESSAGSRKHAPSMATLRRYADAVGCELRITLAPVAAKGKQKHVTLSNRCAATMPSKRNATRRTGTPTRKA